MKVISKLRTPKADQSKKRPVSVRKQPKWMQTEREDENFHDWSQDAPPRSLPLDLNTRRDFDRANALDFPGTWSRITWEDLHQAYTSEDHCRKIFGITHLDDDLEKALLNTLQHFSNMAKDPAATVCGLLIGSLFIFMINHKAFRRNVQGPVRGR